MVLWYHFEFEGEIHECLCLFVCVSSQNWTIRFENCLCHVDIINEVYFPWLHCTYSFPIQWISAWNASVVHHQNVWGKYVYNFVFYNQDVRGKCISNSIFDRSTTTMRITCTTLISSFTVVCRVHFCALLQIVWP